MIQNEKIEDTIPKTHSCGPKEYPPVIRRGWVIRDEETGLALEMHSTSLGENADATPGRPWCTVHQPNQDPFTLTHADLKKMSTAVFSVLIDVNNRQKTRNATVDVCVPAAIYTQLERMYVDRKYRDGLQARIVIIGKVAAFVEEFVARHLGQITNLADIQKFAECALLVGVFNPITGDWNEGGRSLLTEMIRQTIRSGEANKRAVVEKVINDIFGERK